MEIVHHGQILVPGEALRLGMGPPRGTKKLRPTRGFAPVIIARNFIMRYH